MRELLVIDIKKNILLSRYSTMSIGGPADYLVIAKKISDIKEAIEWAQKEQLNFVVVGNGSNILFSDTGYRGLVIINRANKYLISGNEIYAESGAILSKLAQDTLEIGLEGLHFGFGIPGTIGGAVAGNAGALGCDISKSLISAEVLSDGKLTNWTNKMFQFGYRKSSLQKRKNIVILSVSFKLKVGNKEELTKNVMADLQRRKKCYLGRTCGSYFKNPKNISAGQLIDKLNLKGFRIGDAEVSTEHGNVIRNISFATSKDVLEIEHHIQKRVFEECNIRLKPEIMKVGFDN